MALRLSGFTRAASLGPIAEFLARQGACVSRVLRDVDLPFVLLEQPEIVIPLREQFRFLERAARRTGDAHFGARLGQVVRMRSLSGFGAWVCAADTLLDAMARAHAGLNTMLQTSTVLALEQRGTSAHWSIDFLEPETDGRHHNELLGVSYMIDTIRTFAGPYWRPDVVMTALPAGTPRGELETIFGTNVTTGRSVTSITFDAALLRCPQRRNLSSSKNGEVRIEPIVPRQADTLAMIASVTDLALHESYPRLAWVAAKLDMTSRSLQRVLRAHGTTFNRMVRQRLEQHAQILLRDTTPITEIAFRLGYQDPAHFSRAFRCWTGVSPTVYRERARAAHDRDQL